MLGVSKHLFSREEERTLGTRLYFWSRVITSFFTFLDFPDKLVFKVQGFFLFQYSLTCPVLRFFSSTKLKRKYHGDLVLCQKLHNVFFFFFFSRNLKALLICCKLTLQLTKTIDECLCPQMDFVRMDCNLKKLSPNCFQVLFSFPKYTRAGHEVVPFKNSVDFFFLMF